MSEKYWEKIKLLLVHATNVLLLTKKGETLSPDVEEKLRSEVSKLVIKANPNRRTTKLYMRGNFQVVLRLKENLPVPVFVLDPSDKSQEFPDLASI